MEYYVTFNGRTVKIHKGGSGQCMNSYLVNHDIENVQIGGDEFYVIGSRYTTTFRRNGGGNYSFSRVKTSIN